jgi:hypothetical protein
MSVSPAKKKRADYNTEARQPKRFSEGTLLRIGADDYESV